jgi:tRNA A37 threonylcarbamoyladenosine biosynthesis protein TsaE
LNQETGVTLIEWADLIKEILPKDTITINLSRLNQKDYRQIQVEGI